MPQQTTPSRLTLLLVAAVAFTTARAHAQAYTPPPPPLTSEPCKPTKKDPCTVTTPPPPPASTDKFAYPGDVPDPTPKPAANSSPAGSDPFPFPTDDSKSPPSSSSSSSSSSNPSSPSGAAKKTADDEDDAPPPPARHKLAKVEDLEEREAKDIEVARFYMDTGDYLGAYNRAKDALRIAPDDAEAHFAIANAAQKLKKKDEAIAEFKAYLKLEPDGDHARTAERALDQIH